MRHIQRLRDIITADPRRMQILRLVRELALPDCWVAAGLVRNAVWDHLHHRPITPPSSDVDVVWFDRARTATALDAELDSLLQQRDETLNWSVKNQARMHLRNHDQPYASTTDAMRHWPDTATAVAIRLTRDDRLEVAAPFGLDDLFSLIVRPGPHFCAEKRPLYRDRIVTKNWAVRWPQLKILDTD